MQVKPSTPLRPRKPPAELTRILNQQARDKPQSFHQRVLDIQLAVNDIHRRTQELRLATQRLIGPAV